MAKGRPFGGIVGPIRRLFGEGSVAGWDEGELLHRFATRRDPSAMEVLVARHGPMVLGVCRRVLGDWDAAEDAFQATFLVLARKAGSIRDPDQLGPWLHGVAHRVAIRSRANLARLRARERSWTEGAAMAASSSIQPEPDRAELRAALDEEVRRLPEKFRDPIILCYLDGLTHDEAADRLRCPVGTIRSRLATGRSRLRERLTRRGVAVPSGAFAVVLASEAASAAVSPVLLGSTVLAATAFAVESVGATSAGVVSASVISLAEGVTATMTLSKLKIVGGMALAGMLTLGLGTVAAQRIGGQGEASKAEQPSSPSTEPKILNPKQALDDSQRLKVLEVELKEVRQELEVVKSRLQVETNLNRSPNGSVGMGMGMGGGSGGGMGIGIGGGSGGMGMGMGGSINMGVARGMGASGSAAARRQTGFASSVASSGPDDLKSFAMIESNEVVIIHKPKSAKVAA